MATTPRQFKYDTTPALVSRILSHKNTGGSIRDLKLTPDERVEYKRWYIANWRREQRLKLRGTKEYSEQCRVNNLSRRRRVRLDVIKAYGGKCKCCGESHEEFLCLDHINGGGGQHRKQVGNKFYEFVKREGYPKYIRLLCCNCNASIGLRGYCPHKRSK